jgi:hypothetical protein
MSTPEQPINSRYIWIFVNPLRTPSKGVSNLSVKEGRERYGPNIAQVTDSISVY